ncbi:4-hydroxybutyrate dehydrogenase [uncultured Treponema sp.]|uniref:4-hydroxybutyrate dehydrogenase n=1 Tax=uncultured Treponema sp. TaxID=162155 RepID=UPI0015BF726B|nr:4-hydroxybutyrate dehydrogenase [uncultured Treponema sp.]
MKTFKIVPEITEYSDVCDFCRDFALNPGDLFFMSRSSEKYFEGKLNGATVIYRNDYGSGEPTDTMVEKIWEDVKDIPYTRVIAVGGGTIIDVAKLLALETFHPVLDLYDKKIPAKRTRELVIVPTTCGTGSEVTNISILELTVRHTKMGLAADALYPDHAVLIPELLESLPYRFFATSSIDALVHAMESFLSPKATSISRQFSLKATEIILTNYLKLISSGKDILIDCLKDFLLASTYAGIAFGNAGTGYVHAMSYSFGGTYHVPHGEANYVLFTAVFKTYQKMNPNGAIKILNSKLKEILNCREDEVYEKLEEVLNAILPLKPMSFYGAKKEDLEVFSKNTTEVQTRLTANGYISFTESQVRKIYESVL